jgi:hypothetical protein
MRKQYNDANKTSYKFFGLAVIGHPVTVYKAEHFTLRKEAHMLFFGLSSIDIKVKEALKWPAHSTQVFYLVSYLLSLHSMPMALSSSRQK